ncbi:MAG: hypothetical protein CL846_05430 [Crocinitomicaceae bacterium]|nr:hypothetical protein [Crocinitomicaceae bacterium]|tara:strand:- start:115 stop:546 length:432 start_codon:yes stop_codon:yes gene_type:complete
MKKNKVSLKPILYPNKILIAWKEAISGNKEIRNWLMKSKYKELGIFCFALNNDKSSRKWLFNNGYAHLLATIEGTEGKEDALVWLQKNNYMLLFHVARSADSYVESKKWLKQNDKLMLAISLQMEYIKDEIEDKNIDPHRINP